MRLPGLQQDILNIINTNPGTTLNQLRHQLGQTFGTRFTHDEIQHELDHLLTRNNPFIYEHDNPNGQLPGYSPTRN